MFLSVGVHLKFVSENVIFVNLPQIQALLRFGKKPDIHPGMIVR